MAAGCLQIFLEEFFLAWSSNQGMLSPAWALHSKQKIGPPMPAALEKQLNSFMVPLTQSSYSHGQETMAPWKLRRAKLHSAKILSLKLLWQYTQGDKCDVYVKLIFIILYKTVTLSKIHNRDFVNDLKMSK